jgi:hypothetical protein
VFSLSAKRLAQFLKRFAVAVKAVERYRQPRADGRW